MLQNGIEGVNRIEADESVPRVYKGLEGFFGKVSLVLVHLALKLFGVSVLLGDKAVKTAGFLYAH